MTVYVQIQGKPRARLPLVVVRRRATVLLRALALDSADLSILICDDATIHSLNRIHRHIDRPTDVLAYAMHDAPLPPALRVLRHHPRQTLGDIVISLDTAQRQAQERGHRLAEEFNFLLTHGLLHLLGFDHQTKNEERRMWARMDMLRSTLRD